MTTEPVELPDPDFPPLDPDDEAALHEALIASQDDVDAGRLIDAEEVLRELRGL